MGFRVRKRIKNLFWAQGSGLPDSKSRSLARDRVGTNIKVVFDLGMEFLGFLKWVGSARLGLTES